MRVLCGLADIHDFRDVLCHSRLIWLPVGFRQIVKLKLVNGEYASLPLRFPERLPVYGVLVLEALQVYLFNCVLSKTGQFSHLLVGKSVDQQILCELEKLSGDVVAVRLEEYALHLRMAAIWAAVLIPNKACNK